MSTRSWWRTGFLGLTALVLSAEIWASVDGSPDTEPWTALIVRYVPGEVTAAAIGALSLWLIVHFWRRYRRRADQSWERSRD